MESRAFDTVFETFCEMIDSLPPKAILRAAAAEKRMLEDDLEMKRTSREWDSVSVLNFCRFLANAARGVPSIFPVRRLEHWAHYRRIVQRLVDAGELPGNAKHQFDFTFCEALGRAVALPISPAR